MTIRWNDTDRTVELSVLDLVAHGGHSSHLRLDLVQRATTRLALGRFVHAEEQSHRAAAEPTFLAEVRLRRQLAVGDWTATVHGRVDGMATEAGRVVVEEVKSTAMASDRLFRTTIADFPRYAAQVELYLWMLAATDQADPHGRIVLVSVADGARHVLPVPCDGERVDAFARVALADLVRERERRTAWMAARRGLAIGVPFDAWRPGQAEIAAATEAALDAHRPILVSAPTGLGKTGSVLYAALRHALASGKQVFWATSRNTQQAVIQAALKRFGPGLRTVTLASRARSCLNDIVACRPETCRFAEKHHDKVRAADLVHALATHGDGDLDALKAAGTAHVVCPHGLAVELTDRVDVVVGDVNYVFDPDVFLRQAFTERPEEWVVVVDEAHQLVDRARGWSSPKVDATLARAAIDALSADERMVPFLEAARDALDRIIEDVSLAEGPFVDGESPAQPSLRLWRDLADRIDELGLDYALLSADRAPIEDDPWLALARAVLAFATVLERQDPAVVAIVSARPQHEGVALVCLDPSGWLGPRIAALGGFVAVSATLRPTGFYRDLLGLDGDRLDTIEVPSPFPPENRAIVAVPRVSTAWKDRARDADATAAVLAACVAAIPGNAAVYFPSFAMLADLAGRLDLPDRDLLAQEPGMSDARRREFLDRLSTGARPAVLLAVLGGIFAEGVDLPAGALHGVLVVGPALPPVGLERRLLQGYFEERYGEGFRYASLVPGLTRVVQAAGRLIRRPEDRGVIVLVDRRFRWRDVQALLPEDWDVTVPDDPAAAIAGFWATP
jgi:DNA excision repair protein ERCC-2